MLAIRESELNHLSLHGSSWTDWDYNFGRRSGKACSATVSGETRYREMERRIWKAAGRRQAGLAYTNGQKTMIWTTLTEGSGILIFRLLLLHCTSIILPPYLPKLVKYWLNYTFLFVRTYTIQLCLAKNNLMGSHGVTLCLDLLKPTTGFITMLSIYNGAAEGRTEEGPTTDKYPYLSIYLDLGL